MVTAASGGPSGPVRGRRASVAARGQTEGDRILARNSDLLEEVPDPLLPADYTAAGLEDVAKAVGRARRITFFPQSSDLGP